MKTGDGDERSCRDGDPGRVSYETQQTRHSRYVLDANPIVYPLLECYSVASMHPTVEEKNEDLWCGNVENRIGVEMDHMHSNIAAAQNQVSNVTQCEFPGLRNNSCVEAGDNLNKSLNTGPCDFRNSHGVTIQSRDLDLPSDNQKIDKRFAQGDSQRSNNLKKSTEEDNSVTKDEISESAIFAECEGIRLQGKLTSGNNDSNQKSLELAKLKYRLAQIKAEPGSSSQQDFQITSEPQRKKRWFVCPKCNVGFAKVKLLRSHRLKEHSQKQFECTECGMQYTCKQTFCFHRRMHIGENLFTCMHCDKKFVQKGQLERHAIVHDVNKQFSCEQCGKRFISRKGWKSHSKRCPDIRNSVNIMHCSICNEGFRSMTQLLAHTRMAHKAIFACFDCDKRFHKESTLRVHTMRCHFFEKPFMCNVCDKQFTRHWHGFVHLRTHTREKPYVCHECNIRFALRCALNYHKKRIHTVIGTRFTSDGCNEHFASHT